MLVDSRIRNGLLLPASLLLSSLAGAVTCTQQILDGPRTLSVDNPGVFEIYIVDPQANTDLGFGDVLPDAITFEFYANGAPIGAGTFDLGSGDNSNYNTCNQCIRVLMDFSAGRPKKFFFQTGGTLTVDAMTLPGSDPIIMSWQNVTLAEVTIDPNTLVSTLVPNGDCFTIVDDEIFANDFE